MAGKGNASRARCFARRMGCLLDRRDTADAYPALQDDALRAIRHSGVRTPGRRTRVLASVPEGANRITSSPAVCLSTCAGMIR